MNGFRLIADSDPDRKYTDGNSGALNISATPFERADFNHTAFGLPKCMLKSFGVEILTEDGIWKTVYSKENNYQRMIIGKIEVYTTVVRLIPKSTYFSE